MAKVITSPQEKGEIFEARLRASLLHLFEKLVEDHGNVSIKTQNIMDLVLQPEPIQCKKLVEVLDLLDFEVSLNWKER